MYCAMGWLANIDEISTVVEKEVQNLEHEVSVLKNTVKRTEAEYGEDRAKKEEEYMSLKKEKVLFLYGL